MMNRLAVFSCFVLLAMLSATSQSALALKECGSAKLSVLFWEVYESTLYTEDGQYRDGQLPLQLQIRYLRDIKSSDLVKQTAKEWQSQGVEDQRHAQWLEKLQALWPNVSEGDTITLSLDDEGRAQFLVNGAVVGGFDDPDFGRQFSGIWLAPTTTRPKLRSALLGIED